MIKKEEEERKKKSTTIQRTIIERWKKHGEHGLQHEARRNKSKQNYTQDNNEISNKRSFHPPQIAQSVSRIFEKRFNRNII